MESIILLGAILIRSMVGLSGYSGTPFGLRIADANDAIYLLRPCQATRLLPSMAITRRRGTGWS